MQEFTGRVDQNWGNSFGPAEGCHVTETKFRKGGSQWRAVFSRCRPLLVLASPHHTASNTGAGTDDACHECLMNFIHACVLYTCI